MGLAVLTVRDVILGYIRLILEYCQRIYRRQLSKEDKRTSDILKSFHNLLREYYLDEKQMAYSPRYLGDVIHKSTGITPTEFLGAKTDG